MAPEPTSVVEVEDQVPDEYPAGLVWNVDSDGLHYVVRPIRPDDADRLVDFHSHLSAHTSYLRYFFLHPVLSDAEVERFTHVDYRDRLALVAIAGERLIGVGRYDRHPDNDEAEVAFVITDDCQRHGIGSLLLDLLVDAARANGIATFLAETLLENQPMLDVFLHAGFDVSRETEYDTVYLRFPIAPTPTSCDARSMRDSTRHVTRAG